MRDFDLPPWLHVTAKSTRLKKGAVQTLHQFTTPSQQSYKPACSPATTRTWIQSENNSHSHAGCPRTPPRRMWFISTSTRPWDRSVFASTRRHLTVNSALRSKRRTPIVLPSSASQNAPLAVHKDHGPSFVHLSTNSLVTTALVWHSSQTREKSE